MLYSIILTAIIVIFAAFAQIMVLKAVKFGFKISEKPEQAAEEPFFNLPKPKKKPKMTESDKRTAQILANIDRYDGTAYGQVKIQKEKR